MTITNVDAKRIRRLPVVILYLVLFTIALSTIFSLTRGSSIMMNVSISSGFHGKTYHSLQTKEFEFITGMEGRVFWKSKSKLEAFILEAFARTDTPFNAVNIFYTLIFDAILFWMFKNLHPDNIFSERVLKGIKYLSYFLMLLMAKDLLQYQLSNQLLTYFTRGQFGAIIPNSLGYLPYFIGSLILQALPIFISKGQKMEQEQELTV
jgi:hypothetical protein